jgi:nitrogen fixation protein NifU and related proteins
MNKLQDLYQDLILDHGTSPRNYGCLKGQATGQAEGFNPLCGDKVTVYLRLENERVKDIQFEGKGCAISVASASLMTELFQGKTVAEVEELWKSFQEVLFTEVTPPERLGKVLALTGVKAFPARVKCATLAWHAALAALKSQMT